MTMDPFSRPYEACSKCGGRLGTRTESASNGNTRTWQVCRKCSHQILTSEVNIIRNGQETNR